jgi:tryptophan synthase, alpha chain (EC 4.2.1.20)
MSLDAAFDEPAFVPYLAVGDPGYDASLRYVEAVAEGGADVVELGLPFSEPIAEGSTIQSAIVRALEAGMTPDRYFEFVSELDVGVPLVCMTYYNLVYQYGDEAGPRPFVERAAEVGVDGFVIPDLPAEEAGPLRAACDAFGLDLVFIVAPTTRASASTGCGSSSRGTSTCRPASAPPGHARRCRSTPSARSPASPTGTFQRRSGSG